MFTKIRDKYNIVGIIQKSSLKFRIFICLLMFLAISGLIVSAEDYSLNFFTPGTRIQANEINENFTVLESRIEELQNQIDMFHEELEKNRTEIEKNVQAVNISLTDKIDTNSTNVALHGVPVGTIVPYSGPYSGTYQYGTATKNKLPAGWKYCNGEAFANTEYLANGAKNEMYELYLVIGNSWGGSGATYNIPDLRGVFLRGANNARTDAYKDPDGRTTAFFVGDLVGTFQLDMYASHNHGVPTLQDDWNVSGGTGPSWGADNGAWAYFNYTGPNGGNETRPKNAAVNYIIKYKSIQ